MTRFIRNPQSHRNPTQSIKSKLHTYGNRTRERVYCVHYYPALLNIKQNNSNVGNPQSQCNHNAIHGIKSAHPWNLNRKLNYFKICNFHRAPVALTDVYIKLILTAIHNPSTIPVQSTVSKVHPYCKRTRWRTFNVPNKGQQLPTVQHPLH